MNRRIVWIVSLLANLFSSRSNFGSSIRNDRAFRDNSFFFFFFLFLLFICAFFFLFLFRFVFEQEDPRKYGDSVTRLRDKSAREWGGGKERARGFGGVNI